MIKRIGVIGAGQMGSGIAHVCALKGFDIRLSDVDQAHLEKGLETIGRNMDRQIGRGMIRPENKAAALQRIAYASDYKQFADCDLIVEAATENEPTKREIFKLQALCQALFLGDVDYVLRDVKGRLRQTFHRRILGQDQRPFE